MPNYKDPMIPRATFLSLEGKRVRAFVFRNNSRDEISGVLRVQAEGEVIVIDESAFVRAKIDAVEEIAVTTEI